MLTIKYNNTKASRWVIIKDMTKGILNISDNPWNTKP